MKCIVSIILIALIFLLPLGCTQDQLTQAVSAKQQIDTAVAATTQEIGDLQATLTTMPSDTPDKTKIEKQLADAQAALTKLQDQSQKISAVINSLQKGQVTPDAISALGAIPVIGPYVPLAIVLGTFAFGLYQKMKAGQVASTLLAAWHAEGTPGATPAMTAAAASAGVSHLVPVG